MTKKRCVNHWGGTTVQPSIERERERREKRERERREERVKERNEFNPLREGEIGREMIVVDTNIFFCSF